jgi:trk system potassium uptake protein TrkA
MIGGENVVEGKKMKVIILGCGRVGSTLALMLTSEKHEVTVIDKDPEAFRRLGENFQGRTVVGLGIDEEVLKDAGIEDADAFFAVTNGDNTNIMASQMAKRCFGVPKVFARIYDPLRAEVYRRVGIEAICMTTIGAGLFFDRLHDRPFRDIEAYLQMADDVRRLYAADLPTQQQIEERRASARGQKPSYIIIAGGGKVGYHLTKELLRENYEVLLIEKRPHRYQLLYDELGEVVYYGDACEIRTMVRIGMERADMVLAVTGDDEDNLVICQVAKEWFGVPRVIARVNTPRNERIFKLLGIDETISATTILFQMIKQEAMVKELVPIAQILEGGLEIVELEVLPNSSIIGKPVKELSVPQGCLLIALIRDSQASVVTGDTVFEVGDRVLALAPPDAVYNLKNALLA